MHNRYRVDAAVRVLFSFNRLVRLLLVRFFLLNRAQSEVDEHK